MKRRPPLTLPKRRGTGYQSEEVTKVDRLPRWGEMFIHIYKDDLMFFRHTRGAPTSVESVSNPCALNIIKGNRAIVFPNVSWTIGILEEFFLGTPIVANGDVG